MSMSTSARQILSCAAACVLLGAGPSLAATYVWNNAADPLGVDPPQSGDTWGLGSNWSIGGSPQASAPGATDIAELPAYGTLTPPGPQLNAAYSIGGIIVDNSGADYTVGFGGGAGVSLALGASGLTASGGGTFTIQPSFALVADQTWNIAAGTTVTFDRQTLASAGNLNITGGGTLLGANQNGSRTGTTTIGGGSTYRTGFGNALGTGNVTVNDGTLELNAGNNITAWNLQLNDGATLRGYGSGVNAGTYNKTGSLGALPADASIRLESGSAVTDTLVLGSTVSISGGSAASLVTIGGPGKVIVTSGSMSFQGSWAVESGILQFNNNGAPGTNGSTPRPIALGGGTVVLAGGPNTSYIFGSAISVDAGATGTIVADRTTAGELNTRQFGGLTLNDGSTVIAALGSNVTSVSGTGGAPYWNATVPIKAGAIALNGDAEINVAQGAVNNSLATTGITGNGGFEKTGDGRLFIVGTGSYTGQTKVSAGSIFLGVGAANGLGNTSKLTIGSDGSVWMNQFGTNADVLALPGDLAGAGILRIGNTGGGSTTIAGQKVISPHGDTGGAGILSLETNLTASSVGADSPDLVIRVLSDGGVAGVDFDQLALTGAFNGIANVDLILDFSDFAGGDLSGDQLVFLTSPTDFSAQAFKTVSFLGDGTGTLEYGAGSIALSNAAVPEPASAACVVLAGAGLIARRRRTA